MVSRRWAFPQLLHRVAVFEWSSRLPGHHVHLGSPAPRQGLPLPRGRPRRGGRTCTPNPMFLAWAVAGGQPTGPGDSSSFASNSVTRPSKRVMEARIIPLHLWLADSSRSASVAIQSQQVQSQSVIDRYSVQFHVTKYVRTCAGFRRLQDNAPLVSGRGPEKYRQYSAVSGSKDQM